jgi:hypothetical protein
MKALLLPICLFGTLALALPVKPATPAAPATPPAAATTPPAATSATPSANSPAASTAATPPTTTVPDTAVSTQPTTKSLPFLQEFSHLKPYIYEEPPTGLFLGVGVSPIGILADKFMFTLNFFELHWIKDRYDIEIFNAAYAFTKAQSSEFQSTHFTFRASPKYRVFGHFSIGPLLGYELISFSGIGTKIMRTPYITSNYEPFSSRGWIYGAEASQTFTYGKDYRIKVNALVYNETYSTKQTAQGWDYRFEDQLVQTDNSKIAAGTVTMFELSFLY